MWPLAGVNNETLGGIDKRYGSLDQDRSSTDESRYAAGKDELKGLCINADHAGLDSDQGDSSRGLPGIKVETAH